ncbi:hypothetical protein VTJ83DRAFT_6482 [Remersonia thermophila]|uniref:Integral membrane protein n=1 Tax=Remersonia thermophila TaxID=72144 RepID=A0ABR4D746_9PEZI
MASAAAMSNAPRRWDRAIPPVLRPAVRAYLLGYASAVGPRLLTLVLRHLALARRSGRHTPKPPAGNDGKEAQTPSSFADDLRHVLGSALGWQRLPAFCGALVGGATLLEIPLRSVLARHAHGLSELARTRLARWLASFLSGWFSLRCMLQSKHTPSFTDVLPAASPDGKPVTVRYGGRTLDLTFLAVTAAVDTLLSTLWHRYRSSPSVRNRPPSSLLNRLDALAARLADPALFALSSGLVMWAWFYHPANLPRSYHRWISSAAAVDGRLITALQRCRDGSIVYGRDTGQAPLLQAMCDDYGWPREWGDPEKSVPFPCELVHMGVGPSCERHALSRFARSFRWAMATYLPISLALGARRARGPKILPAFRRALLGAARSSTFLASFIALFYYGVCLARTRIGPRLLGKDAAARQRIDGGLCVATGCLLCGWSVAVETAARKKAIALFVAPRALATLFPRRYDADKQWRETLAFAASVAVVVTAVRDPRGRPRVRGMVGSVVGSVFRE